MEDMYAVVSDVEDYKHFVPWCRDSVILMRKPGHLKAKLAVGFPPVVEKYSSSVTLVPPNLVKVSVSFNTQNTAEFYSNWLTFDGGLTVLTVQKSSHSTHWMCANFPLKKLA